jgi:hypothetical protein
MISFPVFERLEVRGYGLFPGDPTGTGLDIRFEPGLTLVLGANGLGKTTLVTLLFRMCTGPYDISALVTGSSIGGANTDATRIRPALQRIFADRVADGAEDAEATLTFTLGEQRVRLTRSLDSLTLLALEVGAEDVEPAEETFQRAMCDLAEVSSFGDWLLVLHHLTFYFEDRRRLVWDRYAQSEILRVLFSSPRVAATWRLRRREILELDSRMRNTQAIVAREERKLDSQQAQLEGADEIRDELALLGGLQTELEPQLAQLREAVANAEEERAHSDMKALNAEQHEESAYRDLERRELLALASTFPSQEATATYLLSKLFSDNRCLACGHDAPAVRAELHALMGNHQCVICRSQVAEPERRTFTARSIESARTALQRATVELDSARRVRDEAERTFRVLLDELGKLEQEHVKRAAQMNALARKLPPEDADARKQRTAIAEIRGQVELMKEQLGGLRKQFGDLVRRQTRAIGQSRETVSSTFDAFARGFLVEECELKWEPHRVRVGQTGDPIAFPNFDLRMSGSDFSGAQIREGPENVSESQREFIDLSFRMALMHAAGEGGVGSLVIDAPESSLDAVFVRRAAKVLMRFGERSGGNRLVVTSNLIEGDLIPALMAEAGIRTAGDSRVIDLLKLARPTRATKQLARDYARVRKQIFDRVRAST